MIKIHGICDFENARVITRRSFYNRKYIELLRGLSIKKYESYIRLLLDKQDKRNEEDYLKSIDTDNPLPKPEKCTEVNGIKEFPIPRKFKNYLEKKYEKVCADAIKMMVNLIIDDYNIESCKLWSKKSTLDKIKYVLNHPKKYIKRKYVEFTYYNSGDFNHKTRKFNFGKLHIITLTHPQDQFNRRAGRSTIESRLKQYNHHVDSKNKLKLEKLLKEPWIYLEEE